MKIKQLLFLFGFIGILVFFFHVLSNREQRYEKTLLTMDTVAHLTAEGKNAKKAVEESAARISEIDEAASPKGENSDLKRLRDMAGKEFVPLHEDVYAMLKISQDYSAKTKGAWDATIGPLTELWDIGGKNHVPTEEEILHIKKLVGYEKLVLRPEDKSAYLALPGMSVTLGGVAKGYALGEVCRIYKKYGVSRGLIDLGGSSIYAYGLNGSRPWRVGLKSPRCEKKEPFAAVSLADKALSTSGDYERFFEAGGHRYHHIMDPKTCAPAESGLSAVTVIAKDGTEADILSTAFFVMGKDAAKKYLGDNTGTTAIFTDKEQKTEVWGEEKEILEEFSDSR